MNKQEIEKAIEILKRKSTIPNDGEKFSEIENSYDVAISALTQQLTNGWIPSPPLVGTECLAQTENNEIIHVYYAGDCKYHFVSYYDREVQSQVKYWQPLPERYKEVSE